MNEQIYIASCQKAWTWRLGEWESQGAGKITLHLLFGWSLDKDEKSLEQSKQFSWQFGSIQTKAFPSPDQPPLEIFLIDQYFCTKHKIVDYEKWKLLETLYNQRIQ